MKKSPFENRDLGIALSWPTLSWSSMNAFESYDKEKWYNQFVLGIRSPMNPAMKAGIVIGERLATDPNYLPEVHRPEIYEYSLMAKFGSINLIGHMDGWSPKTKSLLEYKTTQNKDKWNQKSVDAHGQLDFYCMLLWLNHKIRPEDVKIRLISIPVEMDGSFEVTRSSDPIAVFPTKRTMVDLLRFGARIKKTYKEMQQYVIHKQSMDQVIVLE